MTELLGLPFSPWSEKARWALDVRRIPYVHRHYQPLLGEPALRFKLRRFRGPVTVPVLTTDDQKVLADSADIARWADGRGEGPDLFPPGRDADVARFIELSEWALASGRTLSLQRMLLDPSALAEMVPRGLRRRLGAGAAKVGELGVKRTLRKYGAHGDEVAVRHAMASALDDVRAALDNAPAPTAGPRTLLGVFSFADIAVAQALAFVDPPAMGLKLGAGSRRCFPDPELRTRYADLIAWRDALYATFRAPTLNQAG